MFEPNRESPEVGSRAAADSGGIPDQRGHLTFRPLLRLILVAQLMEGIMYYQTVSLEHD